MLRGLQASAPRVCVASIALGGAYWFAQGNSVHNEGETPMPSTQRTFPMCSVVAWGSNAHKVVAPQSSKSSVKTPTPIPAFDGVALRDLQLAKTYGAAVDADGDVLQWGTGFIDDQDAKSPITPLKTLIGKDIVQLQLSGPKIFALARNGSIYVIASSRKKQSVAAKSWRDTWLSSSPVIDYVKLTASLDSKPSKQKFVSISAGEHHLLALSQQGMVWSLPVDEYANEYGQLGYTTTTLNAMSVSEPNHLISIASRLEPKIISRKKLANSDVHPKDLPLVNVSADVSSDTSLLDSDEIRFATELRPVPALRDIPMAQIATGLQHSAAKSTAGRVVTWGRNTHGQLALGESVFGDTIAVPTEVRWPAAILGPNAECTDVIAGGNNTMFVMRSTQAPSAKQDDDQSSRPGAPKPRIDLIAAGSGGCGSLGNALRQQVCSLPVRVKNVSGLMEYNESQHALVPIPFRSVSIGSGGECALVMDSAPIGNETRRDVWVWGNNEQYQLGNGKHTNLAAPVLLTLASKDSQADAFLGQTPPQNRVLLVERAKVQGASYAIDGRGTQRKYTIAQHIVANADAMAIYGRILL
ncbi:hypothetical protein MPSI1_003265 [Malassezia psittaci]|uniref:Uncharacterized protein n=1 Tax=Malassezia psittaci TaxID=1821823 RepID=A0AAF0FC42_9BASI|nr:hypothetical protein MPSI1_003265 [Malassezia psittaci]